MHTLPTAARFDTIQPQALPLLLVRKHRPGWDYRRCPGPKRQLCDRAGALKCGHGTVTSLSSAGGKTLGNSSRTLLLVKDPADRLSDSQHVMSSFCISVGKPLKLGNLSLPDHHFIMKLDVPGPAQQIDLRELLTVEPGWSMKLARGFLPLSFALTKCEQPRLEEVVRVTRERSMR
jgi:hypothetical protein